MIDFIKKLEKEFDTQIIRSNKHIWENYYDIDNDGNITTLFLDEVNLKDLNVLLPIADSLVKLALTYCNIETLHPLKSFSMLKTLDLTGNNLHPLTLGYLNDLKNLKKLDLGGTNLNDTSLLGDLIGLEILSLSGGNPYCEIKGLEKLKSLQHLNISWSAIGNIKEINVNENLRSLNIGETDIKRITDLERFPYLEELRLNGNRIKKIEGLDKLHNLKKLFISSIGIKKIEGLESLTNLEILELSNNEISKIRGLDSLKNLKELSLDENEIVRVENLDNLTNLELLLLRTDNTHYFDWTFINNLVSECHIYVDNSSADELKVMAPKNVKINFNKDFPYPTSLYESKDFFR
ncbi:leucine-rich repeat domain-containing protein [Chryseobacterium aquaticum]|uniref:Leucine-rich repeat domain-containing protein n=1 Tax=Chryseobacterium aquaticum subsp. greenlandense TaxID=345663 RepID=A0A117KB65_9FLAO|nr:leucine-rich repeat domain-containing protein [Chryseobacterium aquaticum]KUJ55320.1 hypothetical protein AR686_13695 [Chryseobacterium aquaticum subsp. greenlandense]